MGRIALVNPLRIEKVSERQCRGFPKGEWTSEEALLRPLGRWFVKAGESAMGHPSLLSRNERVRVVRCHMHRQHCERPRRQPFPEIRCALRLDRKYLTTLQLCHNRIKNCSFFSALRSSQHQTCGHYPLDSLFQPEWRKVALALAHTWRRGPRGSGALRARRTIQEGKTGRRCAPKQ